MHVYEANLPHSQVRRRNAVPVDSPEKIVGYMEDSLGEAPGGDSLWVICLDKRGLAISRTRITLGTLTGTLAHPGEAFRVALSAKAMGIVVVRPRHSVDPAPGRADHALAAQLRAAAKIARIRLLDQVIVADVDCSPTCFSFRDAGLL